VARFAGGLLVLVVSALAVLPASVQAAPEIDIVAAFLSEHDNEIVGGEPCRRYGGGAPEVPQTSFVIPLPATNRYMEHHAFWHRTAFDAAAAIAPFEDDNNPYGDQFRNFHRTMIEEFDGWRAKNGHDPIPIWDPSTPIHADFQNPNTVPRTEVPLGTAFGLERLLVCTPHRTENPNILLPTWATVEGGSTADPVFGYTALCEFPSVNQLAKAIDAPIAESFHSTVHNTVYGDMGPTSTALRDPLFWPWHNFVESRFKLWESACAPTTDDAQTLAPPTPAMPGPAVAFSLAAIFATLFILRRRSR
jgi:hypothetical protein